jgi:hypothetical protein
MMAKPDWTDESNFSVASWGIADIEANDRVNVWLKENKPQPTIEERLTWLETKVDAIYKRSKKTAATIGQMDLFGEVG